MKKSLIATLAAATLLSPVAFAAEPMELSTAQMDHVTAGFFDTHWGSDYAKNLQIITQVPVAVNTGNGAAVAQAWAWQHSDIYQH